MKFVKPARLLRPNGWLALLSTGERYDDPFASALLDMWVARSDDGGAWVKRQKLSDTEVVTATGLFDTPIERGHSDRMRLPADVVIGVENTRATSLSWDEHTRRTFTEDLHRLLRFQPLPRFAYLVMCVERDTEIDVWRVVHTRRDIPDTLAESNEH